jgi:general secretion pathway protein D
MLKTLLLSAMVLTGGTSLLVAQTPIVEPMAPTAAGGALGGVAPVGAGTGAAPLEPAPIEPPTAPVDPGVQAVPTAQTVQALETAGPGRGVRDFQGDDLGTAFRILARQAKINLFVSDQVQGTVTVRLEDRTPLEAIQDICDAKGLVLSQNPVSGVYSVKTQAEQAAEPTEPANFQFSYAQAATIAPLLATQGAVNPQIDPRTNTVFYQVAKSQKTNVEKFLAQIDRPTRQVMIETRLIEVNANPKQDYGINWSGALLNQQISLRGSNLTRTTTDEITRQLARQNGRSASSVQGRIDPGFSGTITQSGGTDIPDLSTSGTGSASNSGNIGGAANGILQEFTDAAENVAESTGDFLLDPANLFNTVGGQYAILSAPQLSATLSLINQDDDSEFLAHPRVVTADNQPATIKITRNQPVPQLNFNEQTATAVFGGFEDKVFGNTLTVRPTINKDNFVTLLVKPEISNKVGDETFAFAGAIVRSPIIDSRSLESNVLIRSGDTLAIGGLLQDESAKGYTKVPVLGDIPVLGYLFSARSNERRKRNLLCFVTPTIIELGGQTGLEDQVNGLRYSGGDEYSDPNSWRNNAKGAFRLVPTAQRPNVADYPKPGTPLSPRKVSYKGDPSSRER